MLTYVLKVANKYGISVVTGTPWNTNSFDSNEEALFSLYKSGRRIFNKKGPICCAMYLSAVGVTISNCIDHRLILFCDPNFERLFVSAVRHIGTVKAEDNDYKERQITVQEATVFDTTLI